MKTALVLAAGEGSRLFPFTYFVPKPLLPVGGRPLIEGQIRQLVVAGYEHIVIVGGPHAEGYKAALGSGEQLGAQLTYDGWPVARGKAGEIAGVASMLGDCEDFLCMHGDLVANLDLGHVAKCHRESGAVATVVASTQYTLPVGLVRVEGSLVSQFRERPMLDYPVSIGVYCFSRAIVELMERWRPPSGIFELGVHVFPRLVDSQLLVGFVGDIPWVDVGTVDDYRKVRAGPTFDGHHWPISCLGIGPSA